MLKKSQFSKIRPDRIGLVALVCGLALIASACGAAVATSPNSTPIPAMEAVTPTATAEAMMEKPAVIADEDVCTLVTSAEAESLMGQPVTSIEPFSELNSDFNKTIYSCYYIGKDLTFVVSVFDLGSSQAAGEALQLQIGKEQADDKDAIISEESGLGEKAYWTAIDNTGIYAFLKGSKILIVGLGGTTGDVTSFKDGILTVAKSVASKY